MKTIPPERGEANSALRTQEHKLTQEHRVAPSQSPPQGERQAARVFSTQITVN